MLSEIVRIVNTVVHEEVGVADEGVASRAIRPIHEACVLLHLARVKAVQSTHCVIYLANVDALKVIGLA